MERAAAAVVVVDDDDDDDAKQSELRNIFGKRCLSVMTV